VHKILTNTCYASGHWPYGKRTSRDGGQHDPLNVIYRQPRVIVLDMDSSESPTYGEQEGSAYNGHFGCTCLARSAGASDRPLSGHGEAALFPRRRGLRQPGDL
jgi:hypothetical protein